MSARCPLLFSVAFAALFLSSSSAFARLEGDASLTYAYYNGSARPDFISCPANVRMPDGSIVTAAAGAICVRNADGSIDFANGTERNRMSSNSFVQNYSLLYSSNGAVYNNRVGRYDVSLGYNWSALDTTFKSSSQADESFNETRGHLQYRGEINLDPKEVPFRLTAYSRDMNRNSITNSSGNGLQNFGSIFGVRDQATGISDGLHIESGATLVAGVKNGMTNGYNEILRHFPMILIDYKDSINKDLLSTNPVNDRLSRLAFVSLNKKDNWFHYRHTKYEDFQSETKDGKRLNDFVENEFQLGTVDQYMARRWIDFSNWIKVSTDLLYSKRQSNYQQNPIDEINLNLFVAGERKQWNARTFTTFNRLKDQENTLSYQANLPLYVSGAVSQNTSWNARTSFRENHDIRFDGETSQFTNTMAGYRVDAFKQALFTLSQSLDVESSKTKLSDFLTLSGGLESTSTARFSRDVNLGASYNIKNSTTSSDTSSSSDFLEQNLNLHGGYAATNTLRFDLRQSSTFTRGNFTSFNGTTRDSQTQLSQYYNPRSQLTEDIGTESYHSLTSFTAGWNPKPRLNMYLTVNEDIYKTAALGVSPVTEVLSVLTFANDKWSFSDTGRYAHGSKETLDDNANSVSNSASLRYVHSVNIDASAGATYSLSKSNGETFRDTNVEQRANYNYFSKSGVARKLFEVNETLLYTDGTERTNRSYGTSLMIGIKYYPIRQLTLSSGMGYSFVTRVSDYTMVWYSSAVANFRLMQASLDYVHGKRISDKVIEDKFTANIRKSF